MMEWLIVCHYSSCGRVVRVSGRAEQRRRKYCSKACANRATPRFTAEARQRGGATTGRRRRDAVLAQLVGLSPLECFRLGYDVGLKSKLRQLRRRYALVPKTA